MKLAENLKRIRKENNLSQEQLAEKLGVSRQAVSKWESEQSYPEMDKVLMICKLFNYNIDELMNENVKEVDESKESKNNINKYIEDFFEFITKTVDMLSNMKFKQKIKCILEQICISLFLFLIFVIIGAIGNAILQGLIGGLPLKLYYSIRNILGSLYIILGLFIGITIILHIFKIRYLDYYEIIKDDEIKENTNIDEKKKIFIEKNKEKIIIRDPKHSESKFLDGLIRIILLFIKFVIICITIGFVFSFIGLTTLLIISFLFVKTGLVFIGTVLLLTSALVINLVILELLYDFIISKKCKKSRMVIMFLVSIIVVGIGIGLILIGITKFDFIKNKEEVNNLEETYNYQMTENITISDNYGKINYIEKDINEIEIVVKYSKYYTSYITQDNENIFIHIRNSNINPMEKLRDLINNINDKIIIDDSTPDIYIYTSKTNIEKIKQNEKKIQEENAEKSINNLNKKLTEKENELITIKEELTEKDEEINILKQELDEIIVTE